MNIKKICKKFPFHTKIAFRLWINMMLLVILPIILMWVGEIVLFEKNYRDASVEEVKRVIHKYVEDLDAVDLADDDQLIVCLGMYINGNMLLIDGNGKLVAMYSYGHKTTDAAALYSMSPSISYVGHSPEYEKVLKGETYSKIIDYNISPTTLEMGIPVHYNHQRASLIIYQRLDQLYVTLKIHRNQLMLLSIVMTFIAALVAVLLSRRFVKPIGVIKGTVDRLAKGELTATSSISRSDELGQLSGSVNELSKALQRVDVLRKEVIANVSHELRAPLSLIRGYSEMVRDINWKDDKKREDDLNLIIMEVDRMNEMVNDILDYSQLQAGYIKLKKDWHNLYEIIESEVDKCRRGAAMYDITVNLSSAIENIPVYVDAIKICSVMQNLLNNAVNHTEDHEVIDVVVEKQDDIVKVSVINKGEPIPKEDREIIWERYQRSQHQGGRNKGNGIGLSIVSTYLKAHNMTYGVDCKDGRIIFWFAYSCFTDVCNNQ